MSSGLDTEIELITASLLPSESLEESSEAGLRNIVIANQDSHRSLHINVRESYPARAAITIEMKGRDMGRDEAVDWSRQIDGILESWNEEDELPLYQALTADLLALIAPDACPPTEDITRPSSITPLLPIPHHILLTSHHLLSSTKRKDLLALASQLSLTGFSKVGHPGIYYAIGEKEDLEEWLREVKSWNWLALKVRVGIEPAPSSDEQLEGRGSENGARGGKGRGDWIELEKISDALEWMRKRDREKLLVEAGVGG